MNSPWILYFDEENAFWQTALDDLLLAIRESLQKYPTCRLGLAGGSTPKILYEKLAEANLPWEKIIFIQLDERYVPSDNKESNLGMLRRSLLMRAPIPPGNVLAFDTSLPYLSSAEEMNRKLVQLENERRPLLDCLILGAGSDGHIASLFEGDKALVSDQLATAAHARGYETPERLTLSIKALTEAPTALLLLKGREKQIVAENLEGKQTALPLTALHALLMKGTVKVLAYLQNP